MPEEIENIINELTEKNQHRANLAPVFIKAIGLNDAWYQALQKVIEEGHVYPITDGSYKGQKRLEFDFVVLDIKNPGMRPLAPTVPEGLGAQPPTSDDYIYDYFLEYVMAAREKTAVEDYTYGERLVRPKVRVPLSDENFEKLKTAEDIVSLFGKVKQDEMLGEDGKTHFKKYLEIPLNVNQIDNIIERYKTKGFGSNQTTMEIAMPSDVSLVDPPCWRILDTRIRYNKLHFMVYFRSWDLYQGFPTNLGAIQLLKEHMAQEIGVEDGDLIAASKGLHIYDHSWLPALIRTHKYKSNKTQSSEPATKE